MGEWEHAQYYSITYGGQKFMVQFEKPLRPYSNVEIHHLFDKFLFCTV